MSHIVGTVQPAPPGTVIGPDSGQPPSSSNIWTLNFAHTPAPGGSKFVMLHFVAADFPASNRLEVELGYDTDVFTSADGPDFWTRPINIFNLPMQQVPIRYVTNGATTGSVTLDQYGRGERHTKDPNNTSSLFDSFSNCDPFLGDSPYIEPDYAQFWLCHGLPPNWENMACTTAAGDIRRTVAPSVGMVLHVDFVPTVGFILSTCTVTLVGPELVITAGHCMADPTEDGKSSSIIFGYATNCDGTRPAAYSPQVCKVTQVLNQRYADGSSNDYCLMRIKVPPGGLGIAPIIQRTSLPSVGEQVFGIHHPNGAVKKLSIPHPNFATVTSSSSTGIGVDLDVAGGSSGSGLFDSSGQIIGVLSNGLACGLSYFPMASILQDIANPPTITRDVMVVFDRSGSMSLPGNSGLAKIDEARAAASLFIQLIKADTGNRAGLVSFSTTASSPVDFVLSPVTAAAKNTLIGASPFNGGVVGAIAPGGSTTIGGGLNTAYAQLNDGANLKNVLLLTDGLQNTPPMVDPSDTNPTNIHVDVIGYGTPANLDGAMLTQLAVNHGGQYVLADSNLKLQKFFALAFGNIFESGLLLDPEFDLPAGQQQSTPVPFQVCEEEALAIVTGWDQVQGQLEITVTSPLGVTINANSAGVISATAETWAFLKILLPLNGERDGTWNIVVSRPPVRGEFSAPGPALHYFLSVVASGGARLKRMQNRTRYYTGDTINPLVGLQYIGGGLPPNAKLQITVSRPTVSVGNLLSQQHLGPATLLDADIIPPLQATLMAIEQRTGNPSVGYEQVSVSLSDDILSTNAPEAAGLFGKVMTDLLTREGNYTFHCQATYGDSCVATRELMWTVHVVPGIDSSKTTVSTNLSSSGTGNLTITPKDTYGNLVGPGQIGNFTVVGLSGTTVTGPVVDNGDGTYTAPVTWNSSTAPTPGVVLAQPERPPVVISAAGTGSGVTGINWQLLFWLLLFIVIILLALWILK